MPNAEDSSETLYPEQGDESRTPLKNKNHSQDRNIRLPEKKVKRDNLGCKRQVRVIARIYTA